jgi:hypothetical protein
MIMLKIIPLFLALTLTARAQTNNWSSQWPAMATNQAITNGRIGDVAAFGTNYFPTPPASTNMGTLETQDVGCKICLQHHVLAPKRIKVSKIKEDLGGAHAFVTGTFTCPVMGKDFTWNYQVWLRAPVKSSIIRTNLGPPPMPVGVPKIRAPKS